MLGCMTLAGYVMGQTPSQNASRLDSLVNEKDSVALKAQMKVFGDALGEIYDEKDPVENEKKYKGFMARFGSDPNLAGHRFFDYSRYYVAVSYRGNPVKMKEYLEMIRDTAYKTKAYSYAARESYAAGQYIIAEELIRRSLDDLSRRGDRSSDDYYAYCKQYADALYKNKKPAVGLPYAKEAYDHSNKKDKGVNDTYLELLVANGQLREAFPLMGESISTGRASAEVKAQLKTTYIQVKGSEDGFAVYQQSLYDGLKAEVKKQVAQKMVNEPGYAFTLKDTEGKTVSLASYKGKVVVLDFWATWCGPCKASFPNMQTAVDKYRNDTDVVFLFLHTWETAANPTKDAATYISNNHYSFHVVMDTKDSASKICQAAAGFKVQGLPTKLILDRSGNVRFRALGASTGGNDAFLQEMTAMIDLAKGDSTLTIGDPAPPVKVAKWLKGESVDGFEKGKVYVMEFWATWCLPCIAGMPHLSRLAQSYKGKVTISGISIFERSTTTPARIERFVDSMGDKMTYHVGIEEGKAMGNQWVKAAGENGIPLAYIVDGRGRIAWIGLPKNLDEILPGVLDGNWNIDSAAASRKEDRRLTALDKDVIPRLNPFMGNPGKPDSALIEIGKILEKNPALKYYPLTGHFTFYSLLKTDPRKALVFGKAWLGASETPQWRDITDAITYNVEKGNTQYPKEMYALCSDCFQAQLDNYPWSMDKPVTYDKIATLQMLAGDAARAADAEEKAIAFAKATPGFSPAALKEFEGRFEKYKSRL